LKITKTSEKRFFSFEGNNSGLLGKVLPFFVFVKIFMVKKNKIIVETYNDNNDLAQKMLLVAMD
jgi:hypothetical protein